MKTKATPNKSILKYTQLVCLFLAFIVMGCSNDDEVSKSNEKEIISFTFLTADNASLTTLVETTIDEANKTITATLPINTASDGLIPSVIVSDNASYTPEGIQDFTSRVTYTVTAEDASTTNYEVTITRTLTEKEVLQAIFDANPNNMLDWDLENTTDIGDLVGVDLNPEGNITNLNLNGTNLVQLPPEIGQLSDLEALFVFSNNLSAIPKEIGALSNLKNLVLQENQINSLPEELGQLNNLEDLQLKDNPISSIPQAICDLQVSNGGVLTINADTILDCN